MEMSARRETMSRRAADPTPYGILYVVARDFGFAPNPFHGTCTLATCKPAIRSAARVGDWVIGMGGGRLHATGHCLFAMEVTSKMTFDQYWNAPEFLIKRPLRNGSLTMAVGDNIYHRSRSDWFQADSHHSHADGTADRSNLEVDTRADAVLLSNHFYYFGKAAPAIPPGILTNLGYSNGRSHRNFPIAKVMPLLNYLRLHGRRNYLMADPFDFARARGRYSAGTNRIVDR